MKRSIFLVMLAVVLLAFAAFIGSVSKPTLAQTETLTPTDGDNSTPSATDVATDTATEIATEIATEPIPRVLVQVVSVTANFRTGPGRVYRAVTWVQRGNKILLSGISEDHAWYMFKYADENTWISADTAITEVLEGDPAALPVIEAPPMPTQSASDGAFSPQGCEFYNGMTPEAQDSLLQQVYGAVDANDWHQAGQLARHLYICSAQGTFDLLYNAYLPTHPESAGQQTNIDTAFSLFYQGWTGK